MKGILQSSAGLDAEGEEAEVQPAAVALLRVAPFEEEGDEDRAEQEQQLAPLGDDVNVDQREQDVADHTEHQRNDLRADIASAAEEVRRAGDGDNAKDRRCHAEREQNHVRFFAKVPDRPENFPHGLASFARDRAFKILLIILKKCHFVNPSGRRRKKFTSSAD